jgi:hypothetical protein
VKQIDLAVYFSGMRFKKTMTVRRIVTIAFYTSVFMFPLAAATEKSRDASAAQRVLSGVLFVQAANFPGLAVEEKYCITFDGGDFLFTVHDQCFSGDVVCNAISTVDLVLAANTDYTGAVNHLKEGCVSVTLEKSSVWNVTADSYISGFRDTDIDFANIHSNGNTVYYDRLHRRNLLLAGKSYGLPGGGQLIPYVPECTNTVEAGFPGIAGQLFSKSV